MSEQTMQVLRVRGNELLTIGNGAENAHKLALRSRRSYPAIRGYIDDAENRERIDLDVLTSILVDGLGFSYEELLDLRIRDIFRLVEIPVNY